VPCVDGTPRDPMRLRDVDYGAVERSDQQLLSSAVWRSSRLK
jgi:hypothetical protein